MMSDDAASYWTLLLNGKFRSTYFSTIVFYFIITLFNNAVGLQVYQLCIAFQLDLFILTLQTVLPHVELVLLACDIQNL